MNERKKFQPLCIVAMSILACVIMLYIELELEPGYLVKSILKVVIFLGTIILSAILFNTKTLFHKLDKGKLKTCVYIAILGYLTIMVLYFLLDNYIDIGQIKDNLMTKEGVGRDNFIYVAIYISIVNSFVEEAFFRGFTFLSLKDFGQKRLSYLYSSALFAVYHVGIISNWFNVYMFAIVLIGLFVAGILLNVFANSGKSFLCSWPIHIAANLAINTIGFTIL